MIVEQIWTGNDFRNFHYLIVCPETGEAMAIDPYDYALCLSVAKDKGWDITQILNTHEHFDHIGGNEGLVKATGAKVLAHKNAKSSIEGMDRGLDAGDVIRVGRTVELLALDTPGHTMCHVCLLSKTESPSLFTGDTLFNAGIGHCKYGGHPRELFRTFESQLSKLDDNTEIYPGHEYISNNLRFTLDREPGNTRAATLLAEVEDQDLQNPLISTLALEKEINTFFRLQNPNIIANLRESFPDLPEDPDVETVFLKLRELRDSW